MKSLLIASLLFTGCTSGMYLRYSYNRALQTLPNCSRVHAINNRYITYSMIENSTNSVYTVYTNYYRAYYNCDGKIIKTTPNK
jgi:hypothetical protein